MKTLEPPRSTVNTHQGRHGSDATGELSPENGTVITILCHRSHSRPSFSFVPSLSSVPLSLALFRRSTTTRRWWWWWSFC
ncbi:hypothetical protein Hanom_Chr03g00235701 [Helianthus anomalus]